MSRIEIEGVAKKSIPYLIAIILFGAITALYFSPQFSGKQIVMHDVVQYQGMSKEIVDHNEKYGEDPQWTGTMFGGMPAQLIHMHYDSMILKGVMKALDFMGRPGSMIFVAMLSFFLMLLMFKVDPWVAIIPSLAYGLSTYSFIIIGAGHITKMIAFGYAPLMVGAVYYTLRRNMWVGAALTALFASLAIAANHPQITYYFLFVLAGLWINEGVRAYREKMMPRFAKATGLLVLAALLAVGSNLAPLHYINEYGKLSMRGGSELTVEGDQKSKRADKGLALDYATQWSYGKMESFNMFIPNLMGGSSEGGFSDDGEVAQSLVKYGAKDIATQLPAYWGDQPITAGPTYLGAVVIFLFVLGLFLLRGRCKWWVLIVSGVVLMLAWGSNFMWFTELFFKYLPGYNKFRTVAMILVVVQWSVPFLAAFILHKIYKSELDRGEIVRGVRNALYVTGGVALFFLLLGGTIFNFVSPSDARMGLPEDVLSAMRSERASMLRVDAVRSLIFILLTAGVLLAFAYEKIKGWMMLVALALLVCIDLGSVDMRFLPQSKFVDAEKATTQPTQIDLEILADTASGFRVFNMAVSPFQDATTSYFHRSVGGYHGAKLQRYQDVIDRYFTTGGEDMLNILNMLNTKYFIYPSGEQGAVLEQNTEANGAAWFVDELEWADSPNEEIGVLEWIDNRHQAVMNRADEQFVLDADFEVDSTASIEMTEYRSNYLKYRSNSSKPQLAVFSEIYYKNGWQAYIDGEMVPHYRANYILRAMEIPEGDHVVEFRYRAKEFDRISAATLTFSIVIILGVVGAGVGVLVQNRKKRTKN